MVDFIDDYDALTVDEIVERLADRNADELVELRDHESDHKARVTLLDELETRLDQHGSGHRESDREKTEDSTGLVGESDDERRDPDDGPVQGTGLPDGTGTQDDEGTEDGGPVGVNEPDSGDEVLVRYMGRGRGYAAGHWFDHAYDERTVPYNTRIEDAVENGDLQLLP